MPPKGQEQEFPRSSNTLDLFKRLGHIITSVRYISGCMDQSSQNAAIKHPANNKPLQFYDFFWGPDLIEFIVDLVFFCCNQLISWLVDSHFDSVRCKVEILI